MARQRTPLSPDERKRTCETCGMVFEIRQRPRSGRGRFCSPKCVRRVHRDRVVDPFGYVLVYVPGHPRAHSHTNHVFEHVVIVEAALGHPLPKGAEIHHVDECKSNNARTNLVVCENRTYHNLLHFRQAALRNGIDPDTERKCNSCHKVQPLSEFNRRKSHFTGLDRTCRTCNRIHLLKYHSRLRAERQQ